MAHTADVQTAANLTACLLALTDKAIQILDTGDSNDFLRVARALALHFPPVQRSEDVSERIGDLPELSDEALDRMKEICDADRRENARADEGLPN